MQIKRETTKIKDLSRAIKSQAYEGKINSDLPSGCFLEIARFETLTPNEWKIYNMKPWTRANV